MAYWQQDNIAGFFIIEINGNQLKADAYTVDIYNGETTLAYSETMARRR